MLVSLLVLGIIIGSNNLAAALALGAVGARERQYRVAFVFGLFEFFIPLVGIWLGSSAAMTVETHFAWLSPVLLIALGAWTVRAGIRYSPNDKRMILRLTTWHGLVLLAAGLSADNLIVGFSLGLARANPLLVAATIAIFSVIFTLSGVRLGSSARRHWERPVEITAGMLLIGLGLVNAAGWL